jgi:hypothetical protein
MPSSRRQRRIEAYPSCEAKWRADAAVNNQLGRIFRAPGIEVVLQHAERRLVSQLFAAERGAAWRAGWCVWYFHLAGALSVVSPA